MTASTIDNADSPWKEVLERFLPDFLAFCLPDAHAEIDWARGYEPLDKELREVAPAAALGRRLVDVLIKVWRRNGTEVWVLIHIEVQGQQVANFGRRMFGYYCRLVERFNRPIISIAVLIDDHPRWRPDHYASDLWGCAVHYRFPVVKLLDYRGHEDELAANPNPFALVVLTHLAARATRRDAASRAQAKLTLARRLYERGYQREQIIGLFRFIDWIMRLPEDLEQTFWQTLRREEEARGMPYITSVERRGIEQGRQEGRQEGLREGLREGLLQGLEQILLLKFGDEGNQLLAEARQVDNVAVLEAVIARLKTARTPAEVRAVLAAAPSTPAQHG